LPSGATVTAATEAALATARQHADLNAFLELFHESALQQANAVDARVKAGNAGALAGLVLSIKDNICYKDHKVSASSRILEGFTSLYSATVVERLLAADAVILGPHQLRRVRHGQQQREQRLWPREEPAGPSHGARRKQRRRGGFSVAAGTVHVALGAIPEAVHPPARLLHRHCRLQAHLRAHQPLRPDRLRQQLRPDRALRPHRGRYRRPVQRHGRCRPARQHHQPHDRWSP
jgi:hypothetical protein